MTNPKKPLRTWSARQAVAILAVDNIKLDAVGFDLLRRKEEGIITYEQAREEVRVQARAFAKKKEVVG
ncbi:antitoxin VbhA family protein [Rugamonas rubra]|uniref:antitoxin VbhA family protein n=1 Tax=Rugamonas rubra TaxID=758825 RepID=UPI0011137BE2|nr:antitoxin VbhA family protein [Rugamonas rubra]